MSRRLVDANYPCPPVSYVNLALRCPCWSHSYPYAHCEGGLIHNNSRK